MIICLKSSGNTKTYLNLPKEKQDRIFNAAVDEFSVRTFNEAKISNIIKSAEIARGSFYQYFDDKKDLLLYLFDIIGNQKIEYFGEDILNNINNIPFTTLFRELYKAGIMFALEHPKYVALMKNVIASKDDYLREMLQASKYKAIELYSFLIDNYWLLFVIKKIILIKRNKFKNTYNKYSFFY